MKHLQFKRYPASEIIVPEISDIHELEVCS